MIDTIDTTAADFHALANIVSEEMAKFTRLGRARDFINRMGSLTNLESELSRKVEEHRAKAAAAEKLIKSFEFDIEQAREKAAKEIESLRRDTERQIAEVRAQAQVEIDAEHEKILANRKQASLLVEKLASLKAIVG